MRNRYYSLFALAVLPVTAAGYDAEIGGDYVTSTTTIDGIFVTPGGVATTRIESDTDLFDLQATWYFDSVDDSQGPRSRAAFLDRASSVGLGIGVGSIDSEGTVTSSDPNFPPGVAISGLEADLLNFSVQGRHVWAESGWFVSAGYARGEVDTDGIDFSNDAWSLGAGYYLGAATAIELVYLRGERSGDNLGSDSSSDVGLGLTHIGELGGSWQYGADVLLSTQDAGNSNGSYDVRLSLYPNRDLAFGLDIASAFDGEASDSVSYGLFGSYFPTEKVELRAGYQFTDVATSGGQTDADDDGFSLGATVRF